MHSVGDRILELSAGGVVTVLEPLVSLVISAPVGAGLAVLGLALAAGLGFLLYRVTLTGERGAHSESNEHEPVLTDRAPGDDTGSPEAGRQTTAGTGDSIESGVAGDGDPSSTDTGSNSIDIESRETDAAGHTPDGSLTDSTDPTAAETATDSTGHLSGETADVDSPGEVAGDTSAGPPLTEADDDEARVLTLLDANNGRLKQSRVVEETEWSKSKVSMLLSDMHEAGTVTKLRLGRENIICLDGEEPELALSSSDSEQRYN